MNDARRPPANWTDVPLSALIRFSFKATFAVLVTDAVIGLAALLVWMIRAAAR
jgi:hypothetical protein